MCGMFERTPVQKLMDRLADKANEAGFFASYLCSTRSHKERLIGTPGSMIKELPPEDRKLLQTLRSEDLATDGFMSIWVQQQVKDWDTDVRIFGPVKEFRG